MKSTDEVDIADVIRGLKEHLPESLTKNKKFEDLLVAIQNVNKKLKKMLTNDFIDHLKHIVQFWPNLIARIPSWRHIFSVYFISLLFTSSSLPKYFNATKIITEVIWEQQSTAGLVLSALPLLILTPVLLPLNISIQLGVQFAWIALRASYQILMNSIQLLSAVINIIRSLFNQDNSLSQSVFTLFESTLNLTVRLTVNIAIEILDEMDETC